MIANLRALTIFTSYFLLILLCFFTILLRSILLPYPPSTTRTPGNTLLRIRLFTFLALLSFLLTWYHMLHYLHLSYITWTLSHPSLSHTLGNWLHDARLFEEAYMIVVGTAERWWWSQQVFLACFAWGVWISCKGQRGGGRGKGGIGGGRTVLCAYMLLGQLVSVSVAVDLFFVDLFVDEERRRRRTAQKGETGGHKEPANTNTTNPSLPIILTLFLCHLSTSLLPSYTPSVSSPNPNSKYFLLLLLLPHTLLFLPLLLPTPPTPAQLHTFLLLSSAGSVICHSIATQNLLLSIYSTAGHKGIVGIMGELVRRLNVWDVHPAVSSVSWDVVMVGVAGAVWVGVGERGRKAGGGGWERIRKGVAALGMMGVGGAGLVGLAFLSVEGEGRG